MLICCYAPACAAAWQLANASADDLALALFVLRVGGWFHSHTSGRESAATLSSHPLTLDGLSTSVLTHVGGRLLCLHALSSFQRTGTPPVDARRHRHVEDPTDRSSLTEFRGTFQGY